MNLENQTALNTDLGSSFFQSSCKEPRPVFRELTDEELLEDNEERINSGITSWSRDISLLPPISHKLLNEYMIDGTIDIDKRARGADKHKVIGYQLFKEGYVKKIRVKPNVNAEHILFIVKCFVAAAMKKDKYDVYVYLSQATGEILYGKCSCKAGAGGCCKHVSAVLYQLVEYRELELKSVPDDKTCTDILQQWHIPGETSNNEAILFSNLTFEKANFEKDKNKSRKRPIVAGKRNYCSTPNGQETCEQIESFGNALRDIGLETCMLPLLEGNNYNPSNYYQTSRTDHSLWLLEPENKRQAIDQIFNQFTTSLDKTFLKKDDETFTQNHLVVSTEDSIRIEKETLKQSDSNEWFVQRKKRLTASNFGAVINRRISTYPKSLLSKIISSTKSKFVSESCKWGLDNEELAIEKYQTMMEVKVERCGFIIKPKWPWLGCSPDGIVLDRAIEIKCPFSKKDITI